MKILLIGSTGMLGQALLKEIRLRNIEVVTVARSRSTYLLDLYCESEKLVKIIKDEKPNIVINAAALINLQVCEEFPEKAYLLNAGIVNDIGLACREINCYFIQISTDHYYINDGKVLHNEEDEIHLVNEYAKTKYAGECFALTYSRSLVVRTNIVGFRNKRNEPTFIEWVIRSLNAGETITGFDDFYTSSIDVRTFSNILFELIEKKLVGIINIASADVVSKYEFIYSIAKELGKEQNVLRGKMSQLREINRADSLGLDTTKLKDNLDKQFIPTSSEVIKRLLKQYEEGEFYELQK